MITMTPDFTFLDHTADMGIKIRGKDLIDLYERAGKALIHLMFEIRSYEKSTPIRISISGHDLEDLMVRWLGEILYLFDGEGLVITSIDIESLSSSQLEAVLGTTPFNPLTHEVIRDIKAVTYHQIQVVHKGDLWETRIIFDL